MRSAARSLLVAATIVAVAHQPTQAQDSTVTTQDSRAPAESVTAQRDGWIVGPLVGLPGAGSEAAYPLFTLGVGVTRLVPDRMGLDFAIGTAPRLIADGIVPIAARVGPSVPLAMGRDVFFIPSAGVSAIGVASAEDVGGEIGWYAGAAMVAAHGPVGFRAGVTLHEPLFMFGSPLWLAEVGIMSVPLPRLTH
ncbi:MAG TPA: hypothetical protein VF488_00850 [Gemmatimonadaceae bacterium]